MPGSTSTAPADLALLDDEELALVKQAAQYPRVVEAAALAHEPHRIAFFLYDLAARVPRLVEPRQRRSRPALPD